MIPFGEWLPDVAELNEAISTTASNVVPQINGYAPFQGLATYSTALPSACRGMIKVRTSAGDYRIFAATQTDLYRLNSGTLGWDSVTRLSGGSYNCPSDENWWMVQYGTKLVCGNINDNPQVIDVDSGSNFADLAGSPPKARYATVVNDYLVLGSLETNASAEHWSGLNDIEEWTIGVSGSDTQTFPDGGWIIGYGGGEAGYIIQEDAIRRRIFSPGTGLAFTYEKIEQQRGGVAPPSIVTVGASSAYLAEDGFYMLSAAGSENIAANKVARYFYANVNQDKLWSVQGAYDPTKRIILWGYNTTGNNTTTFDKVLIFSLDTKRWAEVEISVQFITDLATQGVTLEGLDLLYATLEDVPVSLDSRIWLGGRPVLGAIDSSNRLGFFTGSALEATLETAEMQLSPKGRAFIGGITPMINADEVYSSFSTRENLKSVQVWSNESTLEVTGDCNFHGSGRYIKFKCRIPAGDSWTYAKGVEPIVSPDGVR